MASISNFGWIIKIGRLAVSDVSPLDQNGKVDFKFSDRKAAMDVRRTKLTSLVLDRQLGRVVVGGWYPYYLQVDFRFHICDGKEALDVDFSLFSTSGSPKVFGRQ